MAGEGSVADELLLGFKEDDAMRFIFGDEVMAMEDHAAFDRSLMELQVFKEVFYGNHTNNAAAAQVELKLPDSSRFSRFDDAHNRTPPPPPPAPAAAAAVITPAPQAEAQLTHLQVQGAKCRFRFCVAGLPSPGQFAELDTICKSSTPEANISSLDDVDLHGCSSLRSGSAVVSSKKTLGRDLPDQLEAHAHRLFKDAGWTIKPRKRNDRAKMASYFTAPNREVVHTSLTQAWKFCGKKLYEASADSKRGGYPKEWSDVDSFWKDLTDTMTIVDKMLVNQQDALTLLQRWQILDPFIAVVFISRKVTALQQRKTLRAVDSSTVVLDDSTVVPSESKRMHRASDVLPSQMIHSTPVITDSDCSTLATDSYNGQQALQCCHDIEDSNNRDAGPILCHAKTLNCDASDQIESHIYEGSNARQIYAQAKVANNSVKKLKKSSKRYLILTRNNACGRNVEAIDENDDTCGFCGEMAVNYFAVTIVHQHIIKLACLQRFLACCWCHFVHNTLKFVSSLRCMKLSPNLLFMPFFSIYRSFQKVVGTATTALARSVGDQLAKRRLQHSQLSSNVYSAEMHTMTLALSKGTCRLIVKDPTHGFVGDTVKSWKPMHIAFSRMPDGLSSHGKGMTRAKMASYFTAPNREAVHTSLTQAWKFCGKKLYEASADSKRGGYPKEWSDVDSFWKDLTDTMTIVDKMLVNQQDALTLLQRWQILDPFIAVVFISRKVTALQQRKTLRAVDSSTVVLDDSTVVPSESKRMHRASDVLPSQMIHSTPVITDSDCSTLATDSYNGQQALQCCHDIEDSNNRDAGPILCHAKTLNCDASDQIESHIYEGSNARQIYAQAKVANNSVKKLKKSSKNIPYIDVSGPDGLYSQSFEITMENVFGRDIGVAIMDMPASGNINASEEHDMCSSVGTQKNCLKTELESEKLDENYKNNKCQTTPDDKVQKKLSPSHGQSSSDSQNVTSGNAVHFQLSHECNAAVLATDLTHASQACKVVTAKWIPKGREKLVKKRPRELRINDDDLLITAIVKKKDLGSCHKFAAGFSGAKKSKKHKNQKRGNKLLVKTTGKTGTNLLGGKRISLARKTVICWLIATGFLSVKDVLQYWDSESNKVVKDGKVTWEDHDTCLKQGNLPFDSKRSDSWFCGRHCKEIFIGLNNHVGIDNIFDNELSWSILRCNNDGQKLHSVRRIARLTECNTKLAVALTLLEECFIRMVDPRTGVDMIPHVLYSKGSKFARLDYRGFYTITLEKGDEILCVASIR
ncbi:hypothetical protein PR202_gb13814 [Eleusine coracana subsp. coracana]|uniref:Increased DNA methylation 1 C-terminal domain-containing protein n=1 Tax=Eleusine coracana subsp. coracana TaxID=191504 RepID=A0AAV5EU14_ELECO|nr:hypothetical protein PR202_gb13814 [Eleusine coracana subsp. coracana]